MMTGKCYWVLCIFFAIVLVAAPAPNFAETLEAGEPGFRLSLEELITMVHQRNERIRYQKLDWDISRDAVKNAEAIFEPEMVASYNHSENKLLNTSTERASQDPLGFLFGDPADISEYSERNNEYGLAFETLVPTGAKVRLGYDLRDLSNSVMRTPNEYKSFLGGSIVQPLLKNAGVEVTMANIRVAEADADIALQGYRREMLQVVAEAAAAYWNLCLAQEKLKVRRESIRIAEEILHDNKERVRAGKMAETEVLEAEAGLATRKSIETAAKQELIAAVNSVKTLVSSSAGEVDGAVVATDNLTPREVALDFESSYRESLKMRPEYVSTMKKMEREGVRIAYAENQKLPQLDLKASYGINGLDTSKARDAAYLARNREYDSWAVGIELRIPIMGGQKTQSELAAAKKRKLQTLQELKATEVALANALDTSIKNVRNALAQADSLREVVRLNKRLLEVERARLDAGVSNSRLVLDRDEDLNRARESYLESLVNFEKASVALEAVKGALLKNYGIEVMEES